MPGEINLEVAITPDASVKGRHRLDPRAAQDGAHAGEQLVYPERLGEIIVGAEIERGNLVAFGVQRGEHDDRGGGLLAHAAADLKTVHLGHHDVQDQEVRQLTLPKSNRLKAIAGFQYLEAACAQIAAHEVAERHLVVGDENAPGFRRHEHPFSPPARSDGTEATVGTGFPWGVASCSENKMMVCASWRSTVTLWLVSRAMSHASAWSVARTSSRRCRSTAALTPTPTMSIAMTKSE